MFNTVSMNSSINFCRKQTQTKPKTQTESNNEPPKNTTVTTDTNSPKDNKIKNAFIAGALAGMVLGGGGVSVYNNWQTEKMLDDMKTELEYTDLDSVKIEDLTDDKFPEIILQDKNGDAAVYDIKSHDIYIKMGDELIEKI